MTTEGKLGEILDNHIHQKGVSRKPVRNSTSETRVTAPVDNKPLPENINSVIDSSQTKSASDEGLKKEYALKLNPYITIQEEAKEDFKKFMGWNEEQFMEKVIVRLKDLDNQRGKNGN